MGMADIKKKLGAVTPIVTKVWMGRTPLGDPGD
jgi:hypothetical protein